MAPVRKRGPYKQYLKNVNLPMPRTTAWRLRNRPHIVEQGEDENHDLELNDPVGTLLVSTSEIVEVYGASGSEGENLPTNESEQESDVDFSSSGEYDGILDKENSDSIENEDDRDREVPPENVKQQPPVEEIPEQNNEYERSQPLYEGCPLTADESAILIMSFLIRWGLEEKSIQDLLDLIDCHLTRSVMGSRYMFLKRFPVPNISRLRFLCPDCYELLPTEFEAGDCPHCQKYLERAILKDDGDFFIELSITQQVKRIVECPSLFPLLRKESPEKDVISGRFYRNLRTSGVIRDSDITLQWNTDGLSPFKSSKVTVWPIQACINELPYHKRKQNMILCGLYYGKKKPFINSFFKPFVDELKSLHSVGFQCKFPEDDHYTNVKVHAILASVDSVARCALQGQKQFNGSYGCSFCLSRGMHVARGGGTAHVYADGIAESRTLAQHMNALRELTEYNRRHRRKKEHVQGVKMPSVILALPVFDIHLSFVPDYLHCVLEGVVKQFCKHWMDSAYSERDWHLSPLKKEELNKKLKAITPPVEVTRVPRGLDELKYFKASEFYHFLLYYSIVCLKGILPDKYIKHWFLLVYGISIFLKESFSEEEALQAKLALNKFVEDIEKVYPGCVHLYTFNVHLLLHIPRAVDQFGGLWASSTFSYEHFNGVLARFITGTRHIPEQICKSYMRLRMISDSGEKVFSHRGCPEEGRQLFTSLNCRFRTSQFSQHFGTSLRLFNRDIYRLSIRERVTIEQVLKEEIHSNCLTFRRAVLHGTLYHASSFEALKVRNNSVVKMIDGQYMSIDHILVVDIRGSNETKCVLLGESFDVLNEVLCTERDLNLSSKSLINVCQRSNRITSNLPKDILCKCVCVPYGNAECLVRLVNLLERD